MRAALEDLQQGTEHRNAGANARIPSLLGMLPRYAE